MKFQIYRSVKQLRFHVDILGLVMKYIDLQIMFYRNISSYVEAGRARRKIHLNPDMICRYCVMS